MKARAIAAATMAAGLTASASPALDLDEIFVLPPARVVVDGGEWRVRCGARWLREVLRAGWVTTDDVRLALPLSRQMARRHARQMSAKDGDNEWLPVRVVA